MTQGKIFDLILRGGHVVDPAAGRDGLFDVGIRAGKIASVRSGLKGARRVIDVSGGYVLPDLIDAHVYRHACQPVELVIWDNRCLLHRGSGYDADRHRRYMRQTRVRGAGSSLTE